MTDNDFGVRRVAPGKARNHPFPTAWFVAAVLLTAAVIAWGATLYASLPRTIPVPGSAGESSGAEVAKSFWSVFGMPVVGLGALVITFILAVVLHQATNAADGASRIPQGRGLSARFALSLFGQIAVLTAFQTAALAFLSWKVPSPAGLFTAVFVSYLVLLLLLVVVAILRTRQEARRNVAEGASVEDEEDAHWKYGLFYVNRDDPSFLVPKRYGVGWTVNFGQPRGTAFFFILLGVLVLAIVAGLLGGR